MKVGIIGNGPAGAAAAFELARSDSAHVTVFFEGYYPLFRRRTLPAVAAGTLGAYDSVLVPFERYERAGIDVRPGSRVMHVLPDGTVVLENEEALTFDSVIVATGQKPRTPAFMLDRPTRPRNVFSLAGPEEADAVAALLEQGASSIVIYGFQRLAFELARQLARKRVNVTAIVPENHPLSEDFSVEIATRLLDALDAPRLRVLTRTDVAKTDISDEHLYAVRVTTEEAIPCHALILDCEWIPADSVVTPALVPYKGIVVDASQRTSADGIFAAGDVAIVDVGCARRAPCRLERCALEQGRRAARALLGHSLPTEPPCLCGYHVCVSDTIGIRLGRTDSPSELFLEGSEGLLRIALDGRTVEGIEFVGNEDALEPLLAEARARYDALDFARCLPDRVSDAIARLREPPDLSLFD